MYSQVTVGAPPTRARRVWIDSQQMSSFREQVVISSSPSVDSILALYPR